MKRFLSIILAIAMIIALVPAVFASGVSGTNPGYYEFSKNATGKEGSASNISSYNINGSNHGWQYITIDADAKAENNIRVYQVQSEYMRICSHRVSNGVTELELSNGIQLALAIERPSNTTGFYKVTVANGQYTGAKPVQFWMGKWDGSKTNSVGTYMTNAAKFNNDPTVAAGSTVTLDGVIYNNGTDDFAFVINTNQLCSFDLKSLTLDKISPTLSLSLDKTVINLNDTATASVNATWTETDGEKTQKVLNEYVTYKSDKPEVVTISNDAEDKGTITTHGIGTATITATVGGVAYTQTLNVVDLSGYKVEYGTYFSSNSINGVSYYSPDKFTYALKNGTLSYHNAVCTEGSANYWDQTAKTNGTGLSDGTYRFIAAHDLKPGSDDYAAYKIRIPAAGDYMASLVYLARRNEADISKEETSPIVSATSASMYILPIDAASDITTALDGATPVISNVNFYSTTNEFKTTEEVLFSAPAAGEYLMVWKNTGNEGRRITPVKLTLNGGDGKAPIWANMSVENGELEVLGTTALTSTVYMSDGVAATETEAANVTYTSTNEAVATISGTTVTAVGAGTAKIQAKYGDYVLGEVDVTVTAPKAPTVSFYAESNIGACPIEITATDVDGEAVVPATAATLTRGADVTVNAPEKEGYLFVGWFRGSKDTGRFVWADSEYTFNAMTHTMLTAVYEEAPEKAYYNFNGEFLGTEKPSSNPTMLGYNFDGWNETVYNNLTRFVANYLKDKEKTYSVTIPSGVSVEKDEDAYYYDTKVTLTSANAVTWLRDEKPVAYGKEYTFYVWDNVEITTAATADTAPKVILDSSKSGAYMIEYDAGDKTIIEKGIIFGNDGEEVSIESCKEKMNSQRSEAHGQFTASSDYTNACGYLIYEDNGEYKVIYAD